MQLLKSNFQKEFQVSINAEDSSNQKLKIMKFLESPLYKSLEKIAEEEIEHWSCIIQDCLETELFNRGFSKESVKLHVNAATKHFQNTHKSEIDKTFETLIEKHLTSRV